METRSRAGFFAVAALSAAVLLGTSTTPALAARVDASNILTKCARVSPETGETEYYPAGSIVVVLNGVPLQMKRGRDGRWHLDATRGSSLLPVI
jgi:hypothetical protein